MKESFYEMPRSIPAGRTPVAGVAAVRTKGGSARPNKPSRSRAAQSSRYDPQRQPPVAGDSTPAALIPIRLGYFQPEAREVFVVGSFNGWNPTVTPMRRDAIGDWSVELALPPGEHRYRLLVDGVWRDDPSAQQTARNPFGGFDAVIVI